PADRERRTALLGLPDPGDIEPQSKPDREIHAHADPAAITANEAHDVGGLAAGRHEVDHGDGAVPGHELRLEDEAVGTVAPREPRRFVAWRDLPVAVTFIAEQCREAGI